MEQRFSVFEEVIKGVDQVAPDVLEYGQVMLHLMKDRRVPLFVKSIVPMAAVAAIKLFRTEGFVKDTTPIIGKLDNIALSGLAIYLGAKLFELLSPAESVAEAWAKVKRESEIRQKVVRQAKGEGVRPASPTNPTGPTWEVKE